MRSKIAVWTVGLSMALAVSGGQPLFAELVANDDGYIVLGITEGPDPIPHAPWNPSPGGSGVLSSLSEIRDDIRPDIFFDSSTGTLVVAWAYRTGADHDIALSIWNGTTWDTEFLTSSTANELDPRVFVDDDGTFFVTWWEPELERVLLTSRAADAQLWLQPVEVAVDARRPSVASYIDGDLMVAFERTAAGGSQEVVLARSSAPSGTYSFQVVATSESADPLDVEVHVSGIHAWIDWKHSGDEFGFVELINGTWSRPTFIPWLDGSSPGAERMRLIVRKTVLGF